MNNTPNSSKLSPSVLSPQERALLHPTKAQKLKEVLQRINSKLTLGMPLSASEMRLSEAVERMHRLNQRISESFDGTKIFIRKTADADPVFDHVKYFSDLQKDKPKKSSDDKRYLGSLSPNRAAQLTRECGAGPGSKEFAQYAMKRLNDDLTKFRAD